MAGQKKFTREKVGQIRNLVENGKMRQEIAELIGVTVGSLQVTCSKLGISLRQRGRRLGDPVAVPDDGCSSDGRQSKREPPPAKLAVGAGGGRSSCNTAPVACKCRRGHREIRH
jgi:hypothetical protein